jgi:hypothetical protein
MSLLPLAVAGTGAWLIASSLYDMKQALVVPPENSSQDPAVKEPFQGAVGHIKQQTFADHSRFVSVVEDRDVQGARIFWVDYGNGQRVQQYNDPRVWL